MDAGQITIVPAAPATNGMPAAMNGTATNAASQGTAFGNLLGQTIAAQENTNGVLTSVVSSTANADSKANLSTVNGKIQLEDGDAAKEQQTDGDLAAAIQATALLAQTIAMQSAVVSQPVSIPDVATTVLEDTADFLTVTGIDSKTVQKDALADVEKNKLVTELSVPVAMAEAAPVKIEAAPVKIEATPVKTEATPVTPPVQRNTVGAPVTANSQQSVSVLMPQSNATPLAPAVDVSAPTNASMQAMQQVTQESQAVSSEVTVITKPVVTNSSATTVRFAQSSDVVAATSDTHAQGDNSSQLAQQDNKSGTAFSTTKTVTVQLESGLDNHQAEPMVQGRPVEHQMLASSLGQHVATTEQAVSVEQLKPILAEQVTRQVAERIVNHEVKRGSDQISLKLSPENLGNVQLNMRMEDQRLKLELVVENRGVRDALLLQKDELKETLARQNIQMDSFSVTTGNGGNNPQQPRDWRQMTADQRQYQPQYASAQNRGYGGGFDAPVQYFAQQYKSTLDVRF